jgi:hypothetical protein
MSTAIERHQDNGALIERVVIHGDLAQLKPAERAQYYGKVCESLGLNPLTRPFEYLKLNGKEILYARRDCTDQLRSIHKVSVTITARERIDEVYVVTSRATTPSGRTDESTGAVNIAGLKGDNLANALMKAETKSKRRVTLSICGLAMLDETELETIPSIVQELHRISPHGEPEDGVVYESEERVDAVLQAIVTSETLEELQNAWEPFSTPEQLEAFHPRDRAAIGKAYRKRERDLKNASKALDAKAQSSSDGDL